MTRLKDTYGPGHTQADYLRALAAGYETGYWDERGIPAPWPGARPSGPSHPTPPPPLSTQENNPSEQSSRRISGYTTSGDLTIAAAHPRKVTIPRNNRSTSAVRGPVKRPRPPSLGLIGAGVRL